MKLMTKLLLGFISISCIVLVAGVVGVFTARTIGQNADRILDEKVPIKDVSMEAIISVIAARDASAEYLINSEGLDEIAGEINEFIKDFDMWIAMVKYGTESSEFKNSAAGDMYIKDGLDIVAQKGTAEMISLAEQADEYHEVFTENSQALIEARDKELESYDELDKNMSIFDSKFAEIDVALEEYEFIHDSWEDKDAAMEARIILAKQKGIGEEYAGLSAKNIEYQTELRGEFDGLTPEYLTESALFPNNLKEKYDIFSSAAVEMFIKKDEALDNWEATHNRMEALDEASAQSEAVLEDLEVMADIEMTNAMERADKAQSQGFLFLIITIIAGVTLAIGIGILLSKGIMKQIGGEPGFIVSITEKVADGDLTVNLDTGNRKATGVTAAVRKMVTNLRNMVHQIMDGSAEISSSSEEMSASAQQLSEGAQSQASTLEETSAAVEELTSSVEQVSDHAQSQTSAVEQSINNMEQVQKSIDAVTKTLAEVSQLANESVEKSKNGAETVVRAVEAINLISESSDKIAGIINVISDIADQTNLLALNASIEAARAGEHGRGFAVVADEVSKLADRSASSTKEIETLIKDSEKNVKMGVELAQESKTSMEQITEGAMKSADMINNLTAAREHQINAVKELSEAINSINEMSQSIGAATEEQTTNAKQTSKAIEDVNEITQQAASAAEEMAASTEELSGMAQQLQGLVSQFKVESGQRSDAKTISKPKELPKEIKEVTDITLKENAA
jgi:methyl-accepting chemotaxis protein